MDNTTDGPIFRANKRRKVFRKRAESNANDDEPHVATSVQSAQVSSEQSASIVKSEEDATFQSDITRVRKPKKHGIAFSSSDQLSSRPHNDNEESALVVLEAQPEEQQNGRFMRPTGKAIVSDDKHMCVLPPSEASQLVDPF